ncbi:MAG: acyl carrier protein [Deltaproteobacteria bacterium]|nr:acyl carrier protein [Deltaproteobacteria bacterium]
MSHAIEERLEKLFKNIFPEPLHPEIRQISQMNSVEWDSLMHLNVVLSLEEEFGVQLNDEDALDVNSFDSAVAVIKSKLGTQS